MKIKNTAEYYPEMNKLYSYLDFDPDDYPYVDEDEEE